MSALFSPLQIRDLKLKNRIVVSPMCQYSAVNGLPNDWHFVHLGSRAVGGAGLVLTEATAISPEGRISPGDLGLWNEAQRAAFARINHFLRGQNVPSGVQLAHAGRKASTASPWSGKNGLAIEAGGWQPLAPSALKFAPDYIEPRAMTSADIHRVTEDFGRATQLALEADFSVVELHFAHGYLVHQFLSPLSNQRTDEYGGGLVNRMRLALEITDRIRAAWPEDRPLFVRLSATDWVEGGWDLESSIVLAGELKKRGADLIDCSTGGLVPHAKIPVGPGYQVEFAAQIKKRAEIKTGAVGMITDAAQADAIVGEGQADLVLIAREMLRDPYWLRHAAVKLGETTEWPPQYARAARPSK